MDIEKLTREIAEKTGLAVNIVVKEASEEQIRNQVQLFVRGWKEGIEQHTKFMLEQMRQSKKECLDIEDLTKLRDSMLKSLDSITKTVEDAMVKKNLEKKNED